MRGGGSGGRGGDRGGSGGRGGRGGGSGGSGGSGEQAGKARAQDDGVPRVADRAEHQILPYVRLGILQQPHRLTLHARGGGAKPAGEEEAR